MLRTTHTPVGCKSPSVPAELLGDMQTSGEWTFVAFLPPGGTKQVFKHVSFLLHLKSHALAACRDAIKGIKVLQTSRSMPSEA